MAAVIVRGSRPHRLLQLAGFGALVAAIAFIATSMPDYRIQRFSMVAAFAVAVLGLNLVTGYSGQISLGHSAFFGLGAYTSAILVVNQRWAYVLTLPVVFVGGIVIGFVVGLPALRIRGLYLALVTLALAVAFPSIAKAGQLTKLTGGANGKTVNSLRQWKPPGWLPVQVSGDGWRFLVVCAVAAVLFVVASNLIRSRVGRSLLALRDNETAAVASGVNPAVTKTSAFALSAGFAAVGGALLVLAIPIVGPEAGGFIIAIELITGLVIGGVATVPGAVVGALAIVWLPEMTKAWGGYVPLFDEADAPLLANLVYGFLLVVVIFVMPGGVTSYARRLWSRVVRIVPRLPSVPSLDEDALTPAIPASATHMTTGGR